MQSEKNINADQQQQLRLHIHGAVVDQNARRRNLEACESYIQAKKRVLKQNDIATNVSSTRRLHPLTLNKNRTIDSKIYNCLPNPLNDHPLYQNLPESKIKILHRLFSHYTLRSKYQIARKRALSNYQKRADSYFK